MSMKNRQHNDQKKKDKQRSTKHTHKTKDRVTRTPLKTGGERRCSGRVSSSFSTSGSGIRRVNLITNPFINKKKQQHTFNVYSFMLSLQKSFHISTGL